MAKMVIPRSRSSGFESIESVKSGSQCRSILSTKDVLPWSTWAITATFRSFLLVWIIAPSCSAAIFAVETAATACGAEEKAARSAANATARSGSAGASSRAGRMLEKLRARRRVVPADIMARVARVGFAQFFFSLSFCFLFLLLFLFLFHFLFSFFFFLFSFFLFFFFFFFFFRAFLRTAVDRRLSHNFAPHSHVSACT